jgi:carbohydrate kinase (thermoresistant glucokinase family)
MKVEKWIVTGISGVGKSTLAKALAAVRSIEYIDADDFHPKANIIKMTSGIPLTDEDRWPWLEKLQEIVRSHEKGFVLACSALKNDYRKRLSGSTPVNWIHLQASKEVLKKRLEERNNHFMSPKLLESQWIAYECPENEFIIDASLSIDTVIDRVLEHYGYLKF